MWKTRSGDNAWKPKEGDSIEGIYKGREENCGLNKNSNLYTIETDKGEEKVWGGRAIDDAFNGSEEEGNAPIEIGAKVRITFRGQKLTKGGNRFNLFAVDVDVPEE